MEKPMSVEYDLNGTEVIVKEETWNGLEEAESQNSETKSPTRVVLVAVEHENAEEFQATADELAMSTDEKEHQWHPHKKRRVALFEQEFEHSEEETAVLESPVSESKRNISAPLSMDDNTIPYQEIVTDDARMCGICGETFSKCNNPDVHRRAIELEYQCYICNVTFTSRRLLHDHKRNHKGYHPAMDRSSTVGILDFNIVRDKRVRSPNLSIREKELLFALIKKHITIIECKKTDTYSQGIKANEWKIIADDFNARSFEFHRTAGSLHNCWENWKKRARKLTSIEKPDASVTGSPSVKKCLDDSLMERIRAILQIPTENVDSIINREASAISEGSPSREQITSLEFIPSEETTFPNGRSNSASPAVSHSPVSESQECDNANALHFVLRNRQQSSSGYSPTQRVLSPIARSAFHHSTAHRHVQTMPCDGVHSSTQTVETTRPCSSTHTSTQTQQGPFIDTSTQTIPSPAVIASNPLTTSSTQVTQCMMRQQHSVKARRHCAATSLIREKARTSATMRKIAMSEHNMVRQCFKMKMQSEEQRMKIEQVKFETENELLEQEKIKKRILLLQLQNLEKQ